MKKSITYKIIFDARYAKNYNMLRKKYGINLAKRLYEIKKMPGFEVFLFGEGKNKMLRIRDLGIIKKSKGKVFSGYWTNYKRKKQEKQKSWFSELFHKILNYV